MPLLTNDNQKRVRKQGLIDGVWRDYDFCSENRNAYRDVEKKRYIGMLTQFRINGIEQTGTDHKCHCWSK